MKFFKFFLLIVAMLLFTACTAPVADAGIDQNVSVGSTVTLDGSASEDANGDELTFQWSFVDKPDESNAKLSDATLVKPTFLADTEGSYIIQLIVNDGNVDSDPDSVSVTAVKVNVPPVADAGSVQSVKTGDVVQLDGSGSSDADDDSLTYKWSITTKPDGSSADLSNETSVNPYFTADEDGEYIVQLIVNDGKQDSRADSVQIIAATNNSQPIANAGSDINTTLDSYIILDGSRSYDPDGDELTYYWSVYKKVDDSNATIDDNTTIKPMLEVDKAGEYVVKLIVNDGTVDSERDLVFIKVNE